MNLAYVVSWVSRNAGGVLCSVSGLAKAVADMDKVQVRVFGSRDEFSDEDGHHWHPVEVHTAAVIGPARLCYMPRMRRMIEAFSPDFIHDTAVWTYTAAVVNQVHARKGIPYLLSLHGSLDPWALRRSAWKKAIVLRLYQQQHFD